MSQVQSESVGHVFVYGSLLFDEVWSRVVEGQYSSFGATLSGYRRHAVAGETYPAVMPLAGSSVQGLVYENVSQSDIDRLDLFEGREYRREKASVTDAHGQSVSAHFYLWLEPTKALDQDWDIEHFKAEGLKRFMATYVVQARRRGTCK